MTRPRGPTPGAGAAAVQRPQTPLERSPWSISLVRAALVGLALALVVGRAEWGLVGIATVPLTFLERWGERQRNLRAAAAQALLLGWVLAASATLAALLQAVYVRGLVRSGSLAQAWSDVWAAYRGLEDVDLGVAVWAPLLPWSELWTWTLWGDAAVDTARAVGVVLAATCVLRMRCARSAAGPRPLRVAGALGAQVPLGAGLALFVWGFAVPPEVPSSHSFTSAQGLEESLHFLGMLVVLAGWTPIAYAIADRCAAAPDDPRGPAAARRGRRASSPVLAGAVLGGASFVVAAEAVPSWVATSPVRRALAQLESPDPIARTRGMYALSKCYAPDPEVYAALVRALDDPHPEVRILATAVLSTYGTWAQSVLERVHRSDPSPLVRKAARSALDELDRLERRR